MDASLREKLAAGIGGLGYALGEREAAMFAAYIELLQRWGKKMNLTSRLASEEIVVYHFLDSLALLPFLAEEGRLLDMGAGAGFPALPLKILFPRIEVTLVDSSHKKASFCREVIRRLGLEGARVIEGRGEDLAEDPSLRGFFDWAVARALGSSIYAARICLPFVREGGSVILMKGHASEKEVLSLEREIGEEGVSVSRHNLAVPFLEAARNLILVTKCST